MGLKSAERTKSKPKIIRNKKNKSWKALRFFALDDLSGFFIDLWWSIMHFLESLKNTAVSSYVCSLVTLWRAFGHDLFWS